MSGSRRANALLLAVIWVISAGIALLFYGFGVLHESELNSVDARFSIRGDREPREDIVLVLIDDTTSQELDTLFPYPRSFHARVIDAIDRDGPKAIAYDVEFLEQTSAREDNALIEAVARAGPEPVVLADTQPDMVTGESGVLGGGGLLDEIGARGANTQLGEDGDGVRRRFPFEVGGLKTFPVAAAETALGEEIDEDEMGGPTAWIDYAGGPDTYPSLSFSTVHNDEAGAGRFTDKIVIVGASDPSLKDVTKTSTTGEGELMSGPEANANAIATALEGFPLQSLPVGVDLLLIVLMGLVAPLASYRLAPLRALALALGAGLLIWPSPRPPSTPT